MKRALLFAGAAILIWSTLPTVSKLLLGNLSSMQLLCISALFSGVTLLVLSLLNGSFQKATQYRLRDYGIMILIGLPGMFFYYVFLYLGTERMQASQAFIINYLWPVMSVLFACLILKESMTWRRALAIGISFLGVITVAGGELTGNWNSKSLMGAAFCVLAAVSYGLFTAWNKKWQYDKWFSMMLSSFASFLLSAVISLAMDGVPVLGGWEWFGLAMNGIFSYALATTFWAMALDRGKTASISNLAYVTPFLSLIWTSLFLKEKVSLWSLAGLLILVGGIFIQLKEPKK